MACSRFNLIFHLLRNCICTLIHNSPEQCFIPAVLCDNDVAGNDPLRADDMFLTRGSH